MGSQKVGHNTATEQQQPVKLCWTGHFLISVHLIYICRIFQFLFTMAQFQALLWAAHSMPNIEENIWCNSVPIGQVKGSLHCKGGNEPSVQLLSHVWVLRQDTRPPCPSPSPRACSNSCPLSQWCHPTISSSVVPFSSHLHSFAVSGSFLMSQFFASAGWSIGVSALASVLPMNIQECFSLGWTGLTSLWSKVLSRVFSNTTFKNINSLVLSFLYSPNSLIHTWLL